MMTKTEKMRYSSPIVGEERIQSERGFAESYTYSERGGGRYEESDRVDYGTI